MNKKNGIKLFVGGITPETTQETLRSYFECFAVVLHCRVEIGKKLKLPKCYGYVTVPEMKSVYKILDYPQHIIDGKKVDVEIAKDKGKKSYQKARPTESQPHNGQNWKNAEGCLMALEQNDLNKGLTHFSGTIRNADSFQNYLGHAIKKNAQVGLLSKGKLRERCSISQMGHMTYSASYKYEHSGAYGAIIPFEQSSNLFQRRCINNQSPEELFPSSLPFLDKRLGLNKKPRKAYIKDSSLLQHSMENLRFNPQGLPISRGGRGRERRV